MRAPLLGRDEQVAVLERLDFVLRSVAELRREVEELRSSLQLLAAEIVGEVRYRPCPSEPWPASACIYSTGVTERVKFKIQKWKKRLCSFHWC